MDTLFLPPLWTEYSLYNVGGCLQGSLMSFHTFSTPKYELVWGLWDKTQIMKGNETVLNHFATNGVPLFIQVQDDTGFTLREIDIFYHRVEDAMRKVIQTGR